jgi:ABC-type multidrug transport system ATPase subunit
LTVKEFVLSAFRRAKSGRGNVKEPLVKTVKLTKEYTNLRALNELSLEMTRGEIFSVLGPNGAGKTTFINLILGNLKPTSGEIRIDGKDFNENMQELRKKIGYCAQETILFDELTVMQHIKLFEGIKEVKSSKADEILDKLLLRDCKDKQVKILSGGQKRKLAVGLALIGDLSIIVLDEPTVGMDTDSRQGLWKLILESKANKLILLTTQNLAEADELSDRVAILNNGTLFGKPQPAIEWKKKYGHGYKLFIEANSNREMKAAENIVKKHIKDIMTSKKDGETKSEYTLPMEDLRNYSSLLEDLEKNKELKLSLEYSSLEDAYLNITELKDNKKSQEMVQQAVGKVKKDSKTQSNVTSPSIFMQFLGLLKLRFILLKRSWSRWLDSLLPLLLIFIGSLGYFDKNQTEMESFLEFAVTGIAYFFLTLAYANLLAATIYTPVHEKEKQLKYTLETNGTKGFTYWSSYILSELFIALIMIIATHIILHILYTFINS